MNSHSRANKKGWETRRKKYTAEEISKKASKAGKAGGKRSAEVRWGYKD